MPVCIWGGGSKAFWTMFKKTSLFLHVGFPYSDSAIKLSQETLLQDYSITFTDWIKERPELITMATEVKILNLKWKSKNHRTPLQGKDKLEWSRTVDSSKLETLKALMADPNYKDNLNVIIRLWHECFIGCWRSMTLFLSRTIYDFAYMTYADLPRGAVTIFTDIIATRHMSVFVFRSRTILWKSSPQTPWWKSSLKKCRIW